MFVIEVVEPPKPKPEKKKKKPSPTPGRRPRVPRVTRAPRPDPPPRVVRLSRARLDRGSLAKHARGSHFFTEAAARLIVNGCQVRTWRGNRLVLALTDGVRIAACGCTPEMAQRGGG